MFQLFRKIFDLKTQLLISSLIVISSGISTAGTVEECKVLSTVLSLEEISQFEKGSASIPAVANADNLPVYSYKVLFNFKIEEVEPSVSRRNRCTILRGSEHFAFFDSKEIFKQLKVGQQLNLLRVRQFEMVSDTEKAYRETWSIR